MGYQTEIRDEHYHLAAPLLDAVEQLRALTGRLQAVREEERSRIAREIHDELGQALTALKMDLAWLSVRLARSCPEESAAPLLAKAESMSELLDTTVQKVRQIATELRPGVLDNLGLAAAIEWQAQEFEKHSCIRCLLATDAAQLEDLEMARDSSTTVFRILQEALTNVARHAGASEVRISLQKHASSVVLEVADNGRGIAEEQLRHACSLGILGMRERAAFVGGVLQVGRLPEGGTRVTVWIPCPEVRGQQSEVGGQQSEVRSQRSVVRSQRSEAKPVLSVTTDH